MVFPETKPEFSGVTGGRLVVVGGVEGTGVMTGKVVVGGATGVLVVAAGVEYAPEAARAASYLAIRASAWSSW